ncbi:nodulation protein NfeD [Inquilinus sp. NPDC058860]|uniref:NfeD family protein n=1 Tax=Inquilinus sp. NPDC058860 TaxID=3346652 RepID=UPI0036B3F7B2
MSASRAALFAAILVAGVIGASSPAAAEDGTAGAVPSGPALMVAIDGPIGPATARHVHDALAEAVGRQAAVVILRLDTPGGLATSMREIIAEMLASPVPVAGFVAPSGAHAASAGTYILYAAHVAAMAPGTNLGAATPAQIGGAPPGLPGTPGPGDEDKGGTGGDAMMAKVTNDAVAFIRSLAELRGRNADWAEKAVREAASLSADAALTAGVIDLVARDPADLLKRIDGRSVVMADGTHRRLATKGLALETIEPGWLIRLLSVITDPNVAIILMLIGVYGLIFEFTSPGAVAPGVIGAVCLVLGFYALDMLPIDYTGLALMLLGVAFLVVEAFNPTVVLGLGGVVAFLLGAAMLLRIQGPGYQLSWPVIGIAIAMMAGLVFTVSRQLWLVRRRPAGVGAQSMQGLPARIIDWEGEAGHVFARGERWQARGEAGFGPGETVEIAGIRGLTLLVRRRAAPRDGDRR